VSVLKGVQLNSIQSIVSRCSHKWINCYVITYRRGSLLGLLQLQLLTALTYLNLGWQKSGGVAVPDALTPMTSLRVTAVPNDRADMLP
jgi:hypothetical protein